MSIAESGIPAPLGRGDFKSLYIPGLMPVEEERDCPLKADALGCVRGLLFRTEETTPRPCSLIFETREGKVLLSDPTGARVTLETSPTGIEYWLQTDPYRDWFPIGI